MAKKRKTITQTEANAYKTKAEGQALLVSAWMPLLKWVASLAAALLGISL